jgi:hypothetical protein
VLRVRTVLLVRDVFLHIKLLKKRGPYAFIQKSLLSSALTDDLDFSQRDWLTDAENLMSGLKMLDDALNNTGRVSPQDPHEQRQTYLLMSSCKLFCMTAQAQIYMETSKLPIVPKDQKPGFRDLARGSIESFFLIYKTFDQENDLHYLDYFITVSRSSTFSPPGFPISLTIIQACWQKIRELYLNLYPGDLEWYPFTEVSRQIILLEGSLRATPAGKNMSVLHSLVNIETGDRLPDEPNLLKEDERLKYGL